MRSDYEKKKQKHYKNISINLMEQTRLEVEFIQEQLKYLEQIKDLKKEQKPFRFKKNSYKKWYLEMEELDKKIFQLYNEQQKLDLQLKQKEKE